MLYARGGRDGVLGLALLYVRGGGTSGVGLAKKSLRDPGVAGGLNIPGLRRNGVGQGVGIWE